eukprot:4544974-Alexandrium_andersonii.AAC.1
MRRAIDPPTKIATANGEAVVSEEVMVKIPTLGSYVWAKVMGSRRACFRSGPCAGAAVSYTHLRAHETSAHL